MQVAKPALVQQNSAPGNLQSTPMVLNGKQSRLGLDMFSPIVPIPEQPFLLQNGKDEASSCTDASSTVYSLKDVSSWVGGNGKSRAIIRFKNVIFFLGKPNATQNQTALRKSPVVAMHNDLDEALAKLQQILANNFTLDGSGRLFGHFCLFTNFCL